FHVTGVQTCALPIYLEAYSKDWQLLEDLRLSDKDANEKKTMNTHLHILEAYTALYRLWPDESLKHSLVKLTELFLTKFIDSKGRSEERRVGDERTAS